MYKYVVIGKNSNHGMITFVLNHDYDEYPCNRFGHRHIYYGMHPDDYHISNNGDICVGQSITFTIPLHIFNLITDKIKLRLQNKKNMMY
jgi:hypothetical protein